MKLTQEYFYPTVTEAGAKELYHFAESILYRVGSKIPKEQYADIIQEIVLRCLEYLPRYDTSYNVPLGGALYWQARGAISMWCNHHKRDIPYTTEDIVLLKAGYKSIYPINDDKMS